MWGERTSFTANDPPIILQSQPTTSPVLAASLLENYWLPSTRTTQSSSYSLTSSPSVAPARLNYERDYASSIFDGDTIPLSSNNRGTKQLSNTAIVHLRQHDYITVVVPPMNPSNQATAPSMHSQLRRCDDGVCWLYLCLQRITPYLPCHALLRRVAMSLSNLSLRLHHHCVISLLSHSQRATNH